MAYDPSAVVDLATLWRARSELGADFLRHLAYFQEDARKALKAIEDATRAGNAAALVTPAHRLKGEALQFGARPLAAAAEHIEMTARRCVEEQARPDELLADAVELRPIIDDTFAMLAREASSPAERRGSFGRKPAVIARR